MHYLVKKLNYRFLIVILAFFALNHITYAMGPEERANKQLEYRQAASKTLKKLFSINPSAKKKVLNAAGYAAFQEVGLKIFVAGGGNGKGVAVNTKTKDIIYMKMLEVQAGLGIGFNQYAAVFCFRNRRSLEKF